MATIWDPSSGYGAGDSPLARQQRQASMQLAQQVRLWPTQFNDLMSEVRTQLAYFKQRRNLGRVTEGEVSRLGERVRDAYEDTAQRLIDSGDVQGWGRRARAETQPRIRSMAREFVDAIQLIALGGGDRETATMVGVRQTEGVLAPTRDTGSGQTPGVSLAEQLWRQSGGRMGTIQQAYETPVEVEVETETGEIEVIPAIAPCTLDAMGMDLKEWVWLVMMHKMGAIG